jgi:hypothetical protein
MANQLTRKLSPPRDDGLARRNMGSKPVDLATHGQLINTSRTDFAQSGAPDRGWHSEVLELCRALAGLPVLATVVLDCVTDDKKVVAVGAALALLAAIALKFLPQLRDSSNLLQRHAFAVAMPWLLTATLTILLIFVIEPRRDKKQLTSSLLETQNYLQNSLLQWQQNLEKATGQCKTENPECLAEKLGPLLEIKNRPHLAVGTGSSDLASDLLAGQLMLANDTSRNILNTRLSITQRFLGAGFSEPVGENNYAAARVPEYLVPNLSDTSQRVWVWELEYGKIVGDKPIMDHKLMEILLKIPPLHHADFKGNLSWINDHLSRTDTRPVLIRFGAWDPRKHKYSGCLGRSDATRVFMTSLGEIKDKTLADASKASGYIVPEKYDAPGTKLFVWIYAPTEYGQAVVATWGNVLANFEKWVTAEPCVNER